MRQGQPATATHETPPATGKQPQKLVIHISTVHVCLMESGDIIHNLDLGLPKRKTWATLPQRSQREMERHDAQEL
jgi:hypothetical protein